MSCNRLIAILCAILLLAGWPVGQALAGPAYAVPATYYVSSSGGNDSNNGLSEGTAFKTIGKVNGLALNAGDRVLFKCGDTWRGEMLTISKSGSISQLITFSSYPASCANQPIISGAQPISGWTQDSDNVYKAQLNAGANTGKFGYGINQLFRGDTRLTLGRWPNLDTPDGGYSTIDSAGGNAITDNQLPAGNWSGAVIHMKSIRWAILNRQVSSSSGQTLSLDANIDCWDGCTGWGYFLNNHRNTLDQDGEWFYDTGTQTVYLYSASGAPADGNVEASVVLKTGTDLGRFWGGITLGVDLTGEGISYVTVENFAVRRWFRDGIALPTNFAHHEPYNITIQNNTVQDVDSTGIRLSTWIYDSQDTNRPDGWRGGYNMTINGNTIERANRMGIDLYSRNSTINNNMIRDIGRIAYLGAAGMGCDYNDGDGSGGICTEDGDGIRIKIDQVNDTGNNNTFSENRLERIGHNGFDIFGFSNTLEHNVIIQPCISKGDCGGARTFGSGDINNTPVYNLTFNENIIVDAIGNTDGCRNDFDPLFGFGLYLDMYSRNVAVTGNTIINSTASGVLFQASTGSLSNNTLYNNSNNADYGASQLYITGGNGDPSYVSSSTGNIFFGLKPQASTLAMYDMGRLGTSDNNYFFHPYRANHIEASGEYSLASWRSATGKDSHSKEHWYTQAAGETPKSHIFYNDTAQTKIVDLGNLLYKDLDQNPVSGSISLAPYTSRILIETGEAADLAVTMALVGSDDTAPGAPVTYTITITNQGILAASNVTLVNTIPAEIVTTAWQANPGTVTLQSGTRYTWQIASLPIGGAYTFTITGQYTDTLTAGTPLSVKAQASTASPDANLANNQASLLLGDWIFVYLPVIRR